MFRFLLVSLNIEIILGEVTIHRRRKKLGEMAQGNGLGDAYTATLGRLKAQKGNKSVLGWKVLMWVLYSERPLRADELCHALGVEIGSTDLNAENVLELRTVNPSVQSVRLWLWTGRTTDCDECPGRTAAVASVLIVALDGLPVTVGVLGGAMH